MFLFHPRRLALQTAMLAAIVLVAASGCAREGAQAAPSPLEFSEADVCELNGLRPYDHPGPKGQIHFRGRSEPVFYCDTVEMMHVVLAEPDPHRILAIYAQDAGQTDWFEPRGHWIDARQATYVAESRRIGPLGTTLAPFSSKAAAGRFLDEFGGRILGFTDITPDDVALDGGALHDASM